MIPHQEYDWDNTPYRDEDESLPMNAPPPLGKCVVLTHYFDANLMHDILSWKAVMFPFGQQNSYNVVFKETSNI